jgi:hypothetical protein
MAFQVILILFIITGTAMAVIWTKDIISNPEIDTSGGFFNARDKDSGNLYWPHWLAEYATAVLLVISPVLIFLKIEIGAELLPFAVGALFYTSLNSLGWAFARKERFAYAFPMLFGLAVATVYFLLLIVV